MIVDIKRTHRERLSALREVFGKRKEIARKSGKKHDVSISKICLEANVDKAYIFGRRLKINSVERIEYTQIKNEILEFQKKLTNAGEQSQEKKDYEALLHKYKTLMSDIEPLQKELARYKYEANDERKQNRNTLDRLTQLQAQNVKLENELRLVPSQSSLTNMSVSRVQRHVVSPDKFRVINGEYRKGTSQQEQDAWGRAFIKLEELLSRNLQMRLYVLVGLPCSGKSTWAESGVVSEDRHPVIWDATNLISTERYIFILSLQRFKNIPKVCVYFDTNMEIIRDRNRMIRTGIKKLTDDELTLMHNRLQKPDPYDETWIDELIIIRQ